MPNTIIREKTPEGVLDYLIDWSAWLAEGETIVDSAWRVDSDNLSVSSDSFSETITTVFLSDGLDRETYTVTNTITTSGAPSKITSRSFKLKVVEHRFLQEQN